MSEERKQINWKYTLKILRRALRHLFIHNGILKLIAIIISVFLWAGLISQDETITRDKYFPNIPVTVTGMETMKNNNYIVVSDIDEALKNVNIVAAVPQKQYESAESSMYNVRLDLSKINGTGEQEVKLQHSSSTLYGKVTSINPSSVKLQVEKYLSRPRVPVIAKVPDESEIPVGWYLIPPTVEPALVAVSGPESIVSNISRAEIIIDPAKIEWKEGTFTDSYKLHLINQQGEEVNSNLLTITTSSLKIEYLPLDLTILPYEYFETDGLVQINGKPARGYEIKNVKISPEVIRVAARQDVLDRMETLSLDPGTVNVDNLRGNYTTQVRVLKPSGDTYLSDEVLTLTVEIEPTEP